MVVKTSSYNQLQEYARLLKAKLLLDASQLENKVDKNITLNWAAHKEDIVVLENGDILISDPSSRSLYECKAYLKSHNIRQGDVYLTTTTIIQSLRAKASSSNITLHADDETAGEKQLTDLISLAVEQKASDIHMHIKQNSCTVHFRIDGLLVPIIDWPSEVGVRIHNVAYNFVAKDKSDNFNRTKPQDISFTLDLGSKGDVRIRSSNIPTNNGGCNIVYRILSIGQEKVLHINELGYTKKQEGLLGDIQYLSSGLVLVCGETGSGKTTSLASVLAGIDPRRKVYSIEDPVEKLIKNVTQIPIDIRDNQKSFAFYLRALLRQDPNVIMVGEIRDIDTAKVAIQSALTGHLILSTLHTRFATDAILRLNELGVDAKILATPNLLKMIVAQELHPTLCSFCRRPLDKDEKKQLINLYKGDELNALYTTPRPDERNEKCPHCRGNGITGRKVFAEIINVDKRSHDYIADMNIRAWQEHLQKNGFVS